jgi:hypothetical protein
LATVGREAVSARSIREDVVEDEEALEEEGSEDETASAPASDDDDTDNVGDASVEINVEELISELESDGLISALTKECQTKKRLEDLMEQRRSKSDLEDFDDYDF